MLKNTGLLVVALLFLGTPAEGQGPRRVMLGDWPEMRGPSRDGSSSETNLPERWALNGENFLWRAPFGGRSAPIVMGNRVYVQNPAGEGPELQERVMALDADTGALIWEYRFNIFQSDVPPHRVGWASPAADPETGNIYALGVGATVVALSPDGELLWDRSIGEEFAAFTTHGGRTTSPLIDGDLVIISAAVSNWGEFGARRHRFIALDKRTGAIVYVAEPGGRPYDTNYAAPLIATLGGQRLLISGGGDGAVHALKPQTGEKVWSFVAAKRAFNTGVVVSGDKVIVSHGDENFDTPEMGMIAAIDGSQTGDIETTEWVHKGLGFGFSSPVLSGQQLYQIDDGATLHAFDVETGRVLWEQSIGSTQRAPLVMADGKFYVGTGSGRFFILRPRSDGLEVLSDVELPVSTNSVGGSEGTPEQIVSGAAISHGRVFFVSSDAVYAIGPSAAHELSGYAVDEAAVVGSGSPAYLQVVPTELTLTPGESVTFRARLFDDRGRLLREEDGAEWSLDGLKGSVVDGVYTVARDEAFQAGSVSATVGGLTGVARARVVPSLPFTETFDSFRLDEPPPGWISGLAGKFSVVEFEGDKVLLKAPDLTLFKRIRMFFGSVDWSDYTVEADVQTPFRRRMQGDVGVTAQRYSLILYGTTQRLKIEPWEPETSRTVTVPFNWEPDTWYHLKLRVENLPDGQVRARGKAWQTGQPEPAEWMIEKVDPVGNTKGSPGMFIDAEFGAHIDNLQVTPNN